VKFPPELHPENENRDVLPGLVVDCINCPPIILIDLIRKEKWGGRV
jgi:hypothetical protein